jgi:hypothetical protein
MDKLNDIEPVDQVYSHYAPIDDIRPYSRTKPYNQRSLTTFIDNYVASETRARTHRDYSYYDKDYYYSRRPYSTSRYDNKVICLIFLH